MGRIVDRHDASPPEGHHLACRCAHIVTMHHPHATCWVTCRCAAGKAVLRHHHGLQAQLRARGGAEHYRACRGVRRGRLPAGRPSMSPQGWEGALRACRPLARCDPDQAGVAGVGGIRRSATRRPPPRATSGPIARPHMSGGTPVEDYPTIGTERTSVGGVGFRMFRLRWRWVRVAATAEPVNLNEAPSSRNY